MRQILISRPFANLSMFNLNIIINNKILDILDFRNSIYLITSETVQTHFLLQQNKSIENKTLINNLQMAFKTLLKHGTCIFLRTKISGSRNETLIV